VQCKKRQALVTTTLKTESKNLNLRAFGWSELRQKRLRSDMVETIHPFGECQV
jgi:hypothetical protein